MHLSEEPGGPYRMLVGCVCVCVFFLTGNVFLRETDNEKGGATFTGWKSEAAKMISHDAGVEFRFC
jgi:hypothetical protein